MVEGSTCVLESDVPVLALPLINYLTLDKLVTLLEAGFLIWK